MSTKTPTSGPLLKPLGGPCAAVKPASRPGTQGLPVCPQPPPPFSTPTPSHPTGPCAAAPASPLPGGARHRALLRSLLLTLSCRDSDLHWACPMPQLSAAPLLSACAVNGFLLSTRFLGTLRRAGWTRHRRCGGTAEVDRGWSRSPRSGFQTTF